jgi:ectoine hydroxylase-related dioxygenase (phytanoyl-CoA dioxygenase family)
LKPHPLNVRFEWKPPRAPYHFLDEKQAHSYDDEGYLVLRGAVDAPTLALLTGEIDRLEAESDAEHLVSGRGGTMVYVLQVARRSPKVQTFFAAPWVRGLLADLAGPEVWLHYDHSLYKSPLSDSAMLWHQDAAYPFIEPQQRVTFWIALTDAAVEDGCLWVLPRSHKQGTFTHRCVDDTWVCFDDTPAGAVPLPVRAGDVVVSSTVTPHYSGANRRDSRRKAYVCQFVPGDAATIVRDAAGRLGRRPVSEAERQLRVL